MVREATPTAVGDAAGASRWERLRPPRGSMFLLLFCSVVLLAVVPVALLLVNTFQLGTVGRPAGWGLGTWRKALDDPAVPAAIWTTIKLGIVYEAIAMVVGVLIAWLIARTDLPWRNMFEFGFWVSIFIPSLTVTISWVLLLDDFHGVVNSWLTALPFVDKSPLNIFSWWGIVWVHLVGGSVAIKVMLLAPAFRTLDSSYEEAARASGDSAWGAFRRISLPILMPAFLMVFVLSMLRALESFEMEYILGARNHIEVVSSIIYRLAARDAPPQYGVATVVSILTVLLAVPFIIYQQVYGSRRSVATVTGKFRSQRQPLGRLKWPAFAFVLVTVGLMTVVPMVALVGGSFMRFFGVLNLDHAWTLDHWKDTLSGPFFVEALWNTLLLGVATAVLVVVWFSSVAYVIGRRAYRGRGLLDFFAWLPSVLPGVVLGLGYLWAFLSIPGLRGMYGTVWILVLVAAAGSMTLAVQLTKTGLRQFGHELEEASRTSSAGHFKTIRHIVFPLMSPTLIVVAVLAFSGAVSKTSNVALLSTSDNMPLAIVQLNASAEGGYAAASVVGVVIFALTLGAALLARVFGYRQL
jgi:iron(III) transport system permease protein